MNKNYFTITALFILLLSGCGAPLARNTAPPPSPREDASARLTQEGRDLLQSGNYDNAIRLLEQAVGLDPNNGQCYYYLAQAWLEKGVFAEAKEFNSLARTYLQHDKEWLNRVEMQANRIAGLE